LARFFTYATLPEHRAAALPYASNGYHVCGSLRAAAELQQQLLSQLALWAEALTNDPGLGHADHGPDEVNHLAAIDAAAEAAQAFRAAVGHAKVLAEALSRAQAALSPLYHNAD
jgi:hypothetical protein